MSFKLPLRDDLVLLPEPCLHVGKNGELYNIFQVRAFQLMERILTVTSSMDKGATMTFRQALEASKKMAAGLFGVSTCAPLNARAHGHCCPHCGLCWAHDPNEFGLEENTEAHTCPRCGAEQYQAEELAAFQGAV